MAPFNKHYYSPSTHLYTDQLPSVQTTQALALALGVLIGSGVCLASGVLLARVYHLLPGSEVHALAAGYLRVRALSTPAADEACAGVSDVGGVSDAGGFSAAPHVSAA